MKQKIEEYVDHLVNVKKSTKNTVDSYKRDLNKMAEYFEEHGVTDVEKVTYTTVNSYILFLEKQGKSSATITRTISSMKTFFHFMLSMGYIKKEPTELITPPKVEKKQVGVNSVDTINRLLKQPRGSAPMSLRDKAMLELLYATGMRVTEITELKINDVNLGMEYVICKNTKKERIIPFGKNAKNAIEAYLKKGRDMLIGGKSCDYLFVNCHGGKLSRQGFWKILKEYADKAGIEEEITPHTLRHSFGAHLVANGADIKAVQEMMGHADIASTQVYINLGTTSIRDVYDRTHPYAN